MALTISANTSLGLQKVGFKQHCLLPLQVDTGIYNL